MPSPVAPPDPRPVSPFFEEPRPADPLWQVAGFSIVRCRDSGLVYLADPPSDADLEAFYSVGYFEGDRARKGYASYERDEPVLRANFRELARRVAEDARRDGRDPRSLDLLDYGCAYGYFLAEMRDAVRSARGLELCDDVAAVGRERFGLEILSGPDAAASVPAGSLDVVTMWDVVEHLRWPRRSLLEVARMLRPGGTLYLTTGDLGSPLARLLGRRWRLINPPQHVTYFSRRTLCALLDACGFDTLQVARPGRRVSLRFLGFILAYLTGGSWSESPRLARWADLSVRLNLFDVVLVRARRR